MDLRKFRLFSFKEKKLAKNSSKNDLINSYKRTELLLDKYSKNGNWKKFIETMKDHKTTEYAMYYKNFLNRKTGGKRKRRNKK